MYVPNSLYTYYIRRYGTNSPRVLLKISLRLVFKYVCIKKILPHHILVGSKKNQHQSSSLVKIDSIIFVLPLNRVSKLICRQVVPPYVHRRGATFRKKLV